MIPWNYQELFSFPDSIRSPRSYDADGIKLEVVHVPGRPQKAAELAALGR